MKLSTGYPQVNEAVYEAVDNLWITIQMRMILIYIPHRVSIHVHKHISTLTMSYANANPFSLARPRTRTYAHIRAHTRTYAHIRARASTRQHACARPGHIGKNYCLDRKFQLRRYRNVLRFHVAIYPIATTNLLKETPCKNSSTLSKQTPMMSPAQSCKHTFASILWQCVC